MEELEGAAAAILTGGPIDVPGISGSTAVLFWRAELSKVQAASQAVETVARATTAAALAHEALCQSMYLQSLESALAPAEGPPCKCCKVSPAGDALVSKGKGKTDADNLMDEDEPIDVDAEADPDDDDVEAAGEPDEPGWRLLVSLVGF